MLVEIERTKTHIVQKVVTYGHADLRKNKVSAAQVHFYQIIPHGKIGDSSAVQEYATLHEARVAANSVAAKKTPPKSKR